MRYLPAVLFLLCASCSSVTDFDRFHRAVDGGTAADANHMDAAVPDAGPCDDPVPETCNGEDDDCDGETDEDFDLDTDPDNCGGCERTCPEVPHGSPGCAGGGCAVSCDSGRGDCDGVYDTGCETDLTSPDSCGGCGVVCPAERVCSSSGCVDDCPGSEEVCGRTCVDTSSSPMHCGGCDARCPVRPHSTPTCGAGTCGFECDPGRADCDGDESNGCETELGAVSDCAACDDVCSYPNGMPGCASGACVLVGCSPGYGDCNAHPPDGCEADLGTVTTCGDCTTACDDPVRASGMCTDLGCDFTCESGWADCNDDPSDGCEVDLSSTGHCGDCFVECSGGTPLCDGSSCIASCSSPTPTLCGASCVNTDTNTSHCGGCDFPCPDPGHASPTCTAGSCGFTCDPGWDDCNMLAGDGCETDIRTLTDCGSCGTSCEAAHGTATCATGICAIASCDTGWADCNTVPDDGCETDIRTVTDCGGCGIGCTVENGSPVCSSGSCAVGSCEPGWGDCDGIYDNGCEEALDVYYEDGDGDGYGVDATATAYCAAGVPSGWATSGGDCHDGAPDVNPGQSEVGCNGKDDDCDDAVDEGDECVPGDNEACTYTDGGCSIGGTRSCQSATCTWGGCEPPAEVCDRFDNDCDGFVDEDQLAATAPVVVHTGAEPRNVRVAWSPSVRRARVVYHDVAGTSSSIYTATVTPGGTVSSSMTLVTASGGIFMPDIAWDGTGWAVAYAYQASASTVATGGFQRITTSGIVTSGSFPVPRSSTRGPLWPRVAVADLSTGDAMVVWVENRTALGLSDYIRYASYDGTTISHEGTIYSASTNLAAPAIAALPTSGDFGIVWGDWSTARTRYAAVALDGTSSGTHVRHTDSGTEASHEIAVWPGNQVFVGHTETVTSGSMAAQWSHGGTSDFSPATERYLPPGTRAIPGWADDEAYSVAYGSPSAAGALRRFRTSDATPVPGDVPLGASQVQAMASMTVGDPRHVLAWIEGTEVRVRFIQCR